MGHGQRPAVASLTMTQFCTHKD